MYTSRRDKITYWDDRGLGERDEDDHSKLLLTKNDSPEFSDIKVQTVT